MFQAPVSAATSEYIRFCRVQYSVLNDDVMYDANPDLIKMLLSGIKIRLQVQLFT